MKKNSYWLTFLTSEEREQLKVIFDRDKTRSWSHFLLVDCDSFYSFIFSVNYGDDDEFDHWEEIASRKVDEPKTQTP